MIGKKKISEFLQAIDELLENNNLPDSGLMLPILNRLRENLTPVRKQRETWLLFLCKDFLSCVRRSDIYLIQDEYADIVRFVQKIGDLSGENYLRLLHSNLIYPKRDTLDHPISFESYNEIPYREFFIAGDSSALHIPTMIDNYLINNSVDNYRVPRLETPLSENDLQRLESHMQEHLPELYNQYFEHKERFEESLSNYKPSRKLIYAVASAAVSGLSLEGFANHFLDGELRQELPNFFYAQLNEIISELSDEELSLLESYPLQQPIYGDISTFGQVLTAINNGGCTSLHGPYLVRFVLDFVEPGFKFSDIRTNYEMVAEGLNAIRDPEAHFSLLAVKEAIKQSKSLIDTYVFFLRLFKDLQLPYKGYKELNNPLLQAEAQKIDRYIRRKSSAELSILYKFGHTRDWKISAAQALRVLFEGLDEEKNQLSEEDFNQLDYYSLAFSGGELRNLFFNCLNYFEGDFAEQIKNRVANIAGMTDVDKEFFRLQTQLRQKSEASSEQQKENVDALLSTTFILFDQKISEGKKQNLVSALRATDTYLFGENSDVNDYSDAIEAFNSSNYPGVKIISGILLGILGVSLLAAAVTLTIALATPAAPLSAAILAPVISLLSPITELVAGLTIANITLGAAAAETVVVSSAAVVSGLLGGGSTFFSRSLIKQGLEELKVKKIENVLEEIKEEGEGEIILPVLI